jgi:hypothetical protein
LEEAKAREKQRYEAHIGKLEGYIEELKKEIKRQHEEIDKAIKIHKANERLTNENT